MMGELEGLEPYLIRLDLINPQSSHIYGYQSKLLSMHNSIRIT